MSKRKRLMQKNRRLLFSVENNPAFAEAKVRLEQIKAEEAPSAVEAEEAQG